MEILNLRILTNKISRKRYKYKSILHGVRNACSKAFVSLNFIHTSQRFLPLVNLYLTSLLRSSSICENRPLSFTS